MGLGGMGGIGASWVSSEGEVSAYGRVVCASVEGVVNGTDVGKNKVDARFKYQNCPVP